VVGTSDPPFGTQPQAQVGSENQTYVFSISNGGTGTLSWSIDPTEFDDWLTMAPVQGTNAAGAVTPITITVNRLGLSTDSYEDDIPIVSNGGNALLHVTMVVPPRPQIGVAPEEINFGLTENTGVFSVANIGDPGTILSFYVVSNTPEWLFNSPSTGVSIGTASPIKDFKDVNISIDRGGINGTSSVGSFTIYALDAEGNIDEEITPATVTVSVEVSPLSFQLGLARTRIPSMVRWDFLMRDFRNRSFFMAPEDLTDAFHIFEEGVPIEQPTETTQVVLLQNSVLTAPVSDFRTDLRTTVMLLLDYSGSMKAWAESIGTTIQDVHEQVAGRFITDYFANLSNVERGFAKLGLMEFHDRGTNANLVMSPTTDSAALLTALQGINIQDNGATALLPAIDEAALQLSLDDGSLIPFDTADVRAVVLMSDGRLTTPPGKIQDTVDTLVALNVRLLGIGWGSEVNHEPLARLADGTGGHYYLTKTALNGDPSIPNFEANAALGADEMATHTVLRYITLNEGDNVPIRFDGAFDNPNDSPDQGVIQGTFKEQDIKLGLVVGDVLLGQISLRSNGVVAGSTKVTLRADYVPRNVSEFEFELALTPTHAVTPVALADGGIVEGWALTGPVAGRYRLEAPPGEVLPYGSIGDLVRIDCTGAPASFTVGLLVDNTIYTGPEAKYFIYPDSLDVTNLPSLAPAFPTLELLPTYIEFGIGLNSAPFTVRNIGGTYPYGGNDVLLIWSADDLPFFVQSVTPDTGIRDTTVGVDTALIRVDRTIAAGTYTGILEVSYTTNLLGLTGSSSILMRLQVLPPVLTTSFDPLNINFGSLPVGGGTATTEFEITNTGQSTLNWTIDTETRPNWVTVLSPISDGTTTEISPVTVTVNPALGVFGVNTWTTSIISNGATVPLTISMNVVP
ncbi:MAG: VWA domain-containing protein, partial [Candidatus Hydrogenedentales bacterium]